MGEDGAKGKGEEGRGVRLTERAKGKGKSGKGEPRKERENPKHATKERGNEGGAGALALCIAKRIPPYCNG